MLAHEYTEEFLQKLRKPQTIAMFLSQSDETKARIDVKEMNTDFKKLEADVSIAKTGNNLLMKNAVVIEQ